MGVDTKQDSPEDPGSLYSFFHPTTFQGWLSLFMGVFGVLMALEWAGSKLAALGKGIAKLFSKDQGAPPSESEMDDLRAQIEDLQTQMQQNQQELLDKFNEQAQLPDNVEDALADFKVELTNQYNTMNADIQLDILNEQAAQIQELAEYGVTPEMEEVANSIRDNINALQEASTPEELQAALDTVKTSIPDINAQLNTMVEQMSEEISAETKAAIQESVDNIKDYQELSDEIDDAVDDLNDGEIPDIDPIE
jgi:DNA anti-recombination protein RmuC